jgi:hypothetical protein
MLHLLHFKDKKVISILLCFKRGPRSTKTVPDASKMVQDAFYTAPIWFKMPEMHLRYYKTSKAFLFK